ncbi:Endoplasmic reticulum-Golgi intermediate compartment protein 1 [Trichinella nelsoni]|uniref:Endoplasmic reticulum-Golgi intermediate compartment protein 1 n=1 Tax=Trichinella nelsoni TaxID=6336 RepID=A0A0V0S359_9BILA|nr:Endoplasmic reticulum-Golgi intermediate compartment protein 1 [Trichinella nelsoni]
MGLERFDIYRKVPKDLTQPTTTGAVISIFSLIFISYLFVSELLQFLKVEIISEMFVSNPDVVEVIPVFLNATLLALGCDYLGLDIQDENGRHEVGFIENVVKHPVHTGGCRIEATFRISKVRYFVLIGFRDGVLLIFLQFVSHLNFMYKTLVPGNFHLSTHSAKIQPVFVDLRHVIHGVRFGDDVMEYNLPGNFNPLMNAEVLDSPVDNFPFSYDYILKIVPTVYENIAGNMKHAYQYTYARKTYIEMSFTGQTNPTLWFRYDFTPITVKYHERRQPLYIFLTSICAIIGGTFTVAGLIDSFFFTASQLYKKVELGKIS